MSDPRHMHEYEPSRKGRCKRIIGFEICGLPEDAPVHRRCVDTQPIYSNAPYDNLYDEADGSCDHGEFL
jgi:hypothetical protein